MTNWQCVLPDKRTQHHFCDIPDKKYVTNKKTLVKLRDILQINWPVLKQTNCQGHEKQTLETVCDWRC